MKEAAVTPAAVISAWSVASLAGIPGQERDREPLGSERAGDRGPNARTNTRDDDDWLHSVRLRTGDVVECSITATSLMSSPTMWSTRSNRSIICIWSLTPFSPIIQNHPLQNSRAAENIRMPQERMAK
jgi:hypothetical protein